MLLGNLLADPIANKSTYTIANSVSDILPNTISDIVAYVPNAFPDDCRDGVTDIVI